MIYQAYQAQADFMAPWRHAARTAQGLLVNGFPFLGHNTFTRGWAASFEMLARAGMSHDRPAFGIKTTEVDGKTVGVTEEVPFATPFCSLLHFKKDMTTAQPRVLLVAPMSGHFSTLLRGTVRTLLPDHDVYITDWHNAQNVSLIHGHFDFDDYIDHVMDMLRFLGSGAHVIAVCQPAVPVLAAVSLLAAAADPAQPASMTLMGGPIDCRRNPTQVNVVANSKPIEWFERNVIGTVPVRYKGAFRRVYPGFLQLIGFMSMNMDRHVTAHVDMFKNLVKGDGESVEATRTFYDEYMAVMDLPAEFYLQTLKVVFQEYNLAKGALVSRGRKVDPSAIEKTALLTVEGEKDDICALGQTSAAHDIVSRLPGHKREQHLQLGVGHYGVFNGRRWSNEIYPIVRNFIHLHS